MRRLNATISFLITCLLPIAAIASKHSLYTGLEAGEVISHFTATTIGVSSADIRNYSFGGRVYGGWQWNDELAVESGYWILRPARVQSLNEGMTTENIKQTLIDLMIQANYPLPHHYQIYGRFGLSYYSAKPNDVIRMISNNDYKMSNVSHFRPIFGLGLKYDLTEKFSIDANWIHVLSHRALPEINSILLGVAYHLN